MLTNLLFSPARGRITRSLVVVAGLLSCCLAQIVQPNTHSDKPTITVPAATKIQLVLTHVIISKSMKPGDDVYAQTSFPVIAGTDTAIPQGAFVQGKIEKLTRKGNRGELQVRFTSVIFPNGYVAEIPGPDQMESDEGTAVRDPGVGTKAGTIAALSIPMGGAVIGAASAGVQGAAIGSGVGLGVGVVAAILLWKHAKNFVLDVGSPLDMVLQRPLLLDKERVADAIAYSAVHPPPPIAVAPRHLPPPLPPPSNTDICYTPGSPGTPDVVIPGTPPIGDAPGTPPTVIPGIPATSPTPHPCP